MSAEDRDLMPMDNPLYAQHYAVSPLRGQLREAADQVSEAVVERRHDAWSRLLATFRAVHGGVEHEDMKLPAYGGSLFDPDRFPFLEGRAPGTHWRNSGAEPLKIDNRTVLHLLEALQLLQVRYRRADRDAPAQLPRPRYRADRPRLRRLARSSGDPRCRRHPRLEGQERRRTGSRARRLGGTCAERGRY